MTTEQVSQSITKPVISELVQLDRTSRQERMADFAGAILASGSYSPSDQQIILTAASTAGSFLGASRESDVVIGQTTFGLLAILANEQS